MLTTETKLIVRYAETDQMGIVHHSNYPIWFEAARTDFIKKMGMPYSKIEENGFMLPLIGLQVSYKGVAKYEDEILIKTKIKQSTNTRLTFYYEVSKSGGQGIITTGETMHVWTNKQLKPVNIKKNAPAIYDLLEKIMGETS